MTSTPLSAVTHPRRNAQPANNADVSESPRILIDKKEAARRLSVSTDTIERLGSVGRLTVYRINTGNLRQPIRYDAVEVEALAYVVPTVKADGR